MKRLASPLALALMLSLTASGIADDKTQAKKPEAKAAATKSDTKNVDAKKSDVKTHSAEKPAIVDEIITFGPVHYFNHSRDFYKRNDMKAAARELNKAASMLDIAADWDKDKTTKVRLTTAAKDLREVAADIEKGKTVSLKKLENDVAKAHVALAWHQFHAQGSKLEDIEGKEANMAGHHLAAAGRYMEGAAKWAGKSLGKETVETVKKLDDLGDKLITVQNYRIAQAEPVIEKFAKELEKLGADIESGAKLQAK